MIQISVLVLYKNRELIFIKILPALNIGYVQKPLINMELMKCRNFENRVGNYGRIFVQALVPRLEHSIA
uniref:BLOC-1-related complex subunit 7 n=1 Tax=Panagrolaimus sp. JU765 TaxID=591449 RepID=A0AC34Q219_9BILA